MPEYDENGNEVQESGSALRDKLEAALADNKRLADEAEAGRRASTELAFARAELPDIKAVTKFREHYDGDLTPEAIRSAAAEWGIIEDTNAAAAASLAGQAQMNQATTGGTMPPPIPGDDTEMWGEFERAVASGKPNAMELGAEVLRRYGHNTGTAGIEMSNSGNSPQTAPIGSPGYSGTPIN